MNTAQAKNIRLTEFLNSLNLEPRKINNNEYWYISPLHDEKTPSFKVNAGKNIWYDFSIGAGGNILDLVMQLQHCNLSQALQHLSDTNFSFSFSTAKAKAINTDKFEKTQTTTEIKKIQTLQNQALIDYLQQRKIDINIAKKHLCEIYYQNNQKNYFAIGFKNNSGNYELRNAYYKGCIGKKDITSIKGIDNKKLSIFEGFMDFLSALTHFKTEFKSDVVVLNSITNKTKINDLLFADIYEKIYLFLDNDKAGFETKREFYNINKNCVDCSNIYQNYKDFNEYLALKK